MLQLPVFVLKTANEHLAGLVLGGDNKPASGVKVSVSGEGQVPVEARTTANGTFEFDNICEGEVRVYTMFRSSIGNMFSGSVNAHSGDTNVVIKVTRGLIP